MQQRGDHQGVEQQCTHHHGRSPLPPGRTHVAASVGGGEQRGEEFARQQEVDTQTENDGTDRERQEINPQGALAHHTANHQDRSHVRCRTGHEEDEGRAGRKPFEHQRCSHRNTTRGAHIHRNGDEQHHNIGQERTVGEANEEVVGHKQGDQTRHDQTDHEPFADVLHHVDEAVAQSAFHPIDETGVGRFSSGADFPVGAVGVGCLGSLLAVLICCVDEQTAEHRSHQRGDGAQNGKRQTQNGVSGKNRVDTRLRGRDEERSGGSLRSPFFAQRHRRGDHAARTERKRDAEERGQQHRTKVGPRKVATVQRTRDKDVQQSRNEEP